MSKLGRSTQAQGQKSPLNSVVIHSKIIIKLSTSALVQKALFLTQLACMKMLWARLSEQKPPQRIYSGYSFQYLRCFWGGLHGCPNCYVGSEEKHALVNISDKILGGSAHRKTLNLFVNFNSTSDRLWSTVSEKQSFEDVNAPVWQGSSYVGKIVQINQ